MDGSSSSSVPRLAWTLALAGLGLVVFAAVALSGPGRIDSLDGQSHFEVGRSLIEHGDPALRDERIAWNRFPGRKGSDYSNERFPQSVLAAGAIWLSDHTGPVEEGRRHFFYVQCGAAACGVLSILYAIWFRRSGCRPTMALMWGAAGVFCTPMWFYGTSTFDDYLGTTLLVAALVLALLSRGNPWGAILTGLVLGLAYNCTQPLGVFAILAWAIHDDRNLPCGQRLLNAGYIAAGLVAGVVAEQGYNRYKFPLAEQRAVIGPEFANHPLSALAAVTVSFGAGAIWYFPPLIVCLLGMARKWRDDRRLIVASIVAAVAFLVWIVSLSDFKGDVSWGPRKLTPLFGVLWLFAPAGAARMGRPLLVLFLGLGVFVQALALSVDPNRLYVERGISPNLGREQPLRYFNPAFSHLLNRPREIVEIARETQPAEFYSPEPSPTFVFPPLDPSDPEKRGPEVVQKHRLLNGFRPWWTSMTWLPPEDRPVPLARSAAMLLWVASGGLILLGLTVARIEKHS